MLKFIHSYLNNEGLNCMLKFSCDYMEGCHPAILRRLAEENLAKNDGYGYDPYCQSACERIRVACDLPDAEVHLLVGGTQTNTIVLDALLRHNEGVLAPQTGHINVHESGAIEASGHKVMSMPAVDGKIDIDHLERHLAILKTEYDAVGWEHYVVPRVLYVSFPTEMGTLYTHAELKRLRMICDQYHLHLFIDGARLGYGLMSPKCDITLPELARLCDVFYIGGTKVGALFGEAVVVCNPALTIPRGLIKQHGALMAKGWLLGLQFDTLFTDGLYFDIARNAIDQAQRLREGLIAKGYVMHGESPTNQQFMILPNDRLEPLSQHVGFDRFSAVDERSTLIRLCTSWATTSEQIDQLLQCL